MFPYTSAKIGCALFLVCSPIFVPEANAQSCSRRYANSSEGVGIDTSGNVWVSGKLNYTLYRYSFDGQTVTVDEFDLPGYGAYGVAVTPVDDDVWVAVGGFKVSSENRVLRFDNDGNLLEDIPIIYNNQAGLETNAVAVDAEGYVWVTSSEGGPTSVARIYPVVDPPGECVTAYSPTNCSVVDMAVSAHQSHC